MVVPHLTLNQWLLEHREQFITFMTEEIAELALASGFTQKEVDESILKRDQRFL